MNKRDRKEKPQIVTATVVTTKTVCELVLTDRMIIDIINGKAAVDRPIPTSAQVKYRLDYVDETEPLVIKWEETTESKENAP